MPQAQRASQILNSLLPSRLEFYRSPISQPEPEKPRAQRPRAATSAAADFAAAFEPLPRPAAPKAIYGSVSTGDIAVSIKAVLAESEEGARVVLGAEDITVVSAKDAQSGEVEADRIKTLGEFEIEIKVKGGEGIRRILSVLPQES